MLRPGGHALLTEHTRPERFEEFIGGIAKSSLRIVDVRYLYDRPWYRFESWFAAIREWRPVKRLLRSVGLARALQAVGRLFGRRASRHVCVIAVRDA